MYTHLGGAIVQTTPTIIASLLFFFLGIVCAPSLAGQSGNGDRRGQNEGEEDERVFDITVLVDDFYAAENEGETFEVDSNDDGSVDYLMKTTSRGEKTAEVLDYDHDGRMDDFYYYDKGVLESRAVDSNSDGMVDIWVYLFEGVYIEKYERDTDYDGVIDMVKDYEKEAREKAEKAGRSPN